MTAQYAVIQGALQGLTEFLPVSSSGHLALFQYFTGQSGPSGITFSIFLHMGTLIAVFIAFYKTILGMLMELLGFFRDFVINIRSKSSLLFKYLFFFKYLFTFNRAEAKRMHAEIKQVFSQMNPMRRMILLIIVSLIPMIISLYFLDTFERVSTDNDIIVEGSCFLITSILLFLADSCVKGHKTAADMKYRDAIAVGVAQAFAPFPGLSRSGSTISVGLMAGLEREFAIAFSFIIGIPPVLGANLMELKNVSSDGIAVPASMIALGMATSLVVGILAIFMVKWLVKTERFRIFAWYTMILGGLTIAVGVFERFTGHMIQEMVLSLLEVL